MTNTDKTVKSNSKTKGEPTYLNKNYPYKAFGDTITNLDSIKQTGVLYEIMCPKCEMSIKSQGVNIKNTYEKLMKNGCIGCGNRELIIRQVDTSKIR